MVGRPCTWGRRSSTSRGGRRRRQWDRTPSCTATAPACTHGTRSGLAACPTADTAPRTTSGAARRTTTRSTCPGGGGRTLGSAPRDSVAAPRPCRTTRRGTRSACTTAAHSRWRRRTTTRRRRCRGTGTCQRYAGGGCPPSPFELRTHLAPRLPEPTAAAGWRRRGRSGIGVTAAHGCSGRGCGRMRPRPWSRSLWSRRSKAKAERVIARVVGGRLVNLKSTNAPSRTDSRLAQRRGPRVPLVATRVMGRGAQVRSRERDGGARGAAFRWRPRCAAGRLVGSHPDHDLHLVRWPFRTASRTPGRTWTCGICACCASGTCRPQRCGWWSGWESRAAFRR